MKKYKQIIALLGAILCLAGCNDKLDLYPETQLTEGLFYKSEKDMIQASNDIYRQLCRIYNSNGIVDLYGERFSDNVYTIFVSGAHSYSEDIHKHIIKSDNGLITTAWRTVYNAIFITNDILTRLENTTSEFSSPALKERIIAETLFVRSLIYFYAVQTWGDIPFPLKVVSAEESYSYLREKKEVIYAQLIKDLLQCKKALPEEYMGKEIGRITTYAASAILAKIYMLTGDNNSAQTELKRIIDSNHYSLDANNDGVINVADYKYLFQADTKNCKESILEIQYMAGIDHPNSNHQQVYSPFLWSFHLPETTATFRGEGHNTPNPDIIAAYEPNDPRRDISITMGFIDLAVDTWVDYPYTNKYYDPNWQNAGQNVEAIRYADILLLYSELTGDPSYLNQVRSRVGLPLYGESGYPSQYNTLELAVEHERRVELAFEFHRFFDLKRTGRALGVLNNKGYNITENELLFPIPLAETDINPKLEQNPGY